MEFSQNKILKNSIIVIIYLVTYRIISDFTTVFMEIPNGNNTPATIFFPALGITMAFLLYFGSWMIPFIPINALILSIQHGRSLPSTLILSLATLVFYGGAGFILERVLHFNHEFKNLKDCIYFLIVTAIASLCTGFSVGLGIFLFGNGNPPDLIAFVITFFLGDIVGIYSLTPLLLLFIFPGVSKLLRNQQLLDNRKQNIYYFLLITIINTIFILICFGQTIYTPSEILFIFFIPLTAISLIMGLKGSIIANNIIIAEVIIILKLFFKNDIQEFQMLMFSLSSVALIIGTVITERSNYLGKVENLVKERTIELENSNKDLQFFSYSVSHDLRTPLNNVNNLIKLILIENKNEINPDIEDIIKRINLNTSKMEILIEELLKFFKFSQQQLEKEFIEMKLLIQQTNLSFSDDIKNKHVEVFIDESIPDCYGDKTLLSLVWTNLISNAIKYSSKVTKPFIQIGWKDDKYYIRDNGVGFDMKDATKLFNVFQRLHPDSEYEGTGIGLALVKRIILKHGGTIWAESEINKGTTFYFTIKNENNFIQT